MPKTTSTTEPTAEPPGAKKAGPCDLFKISEIETIFGALDGEPETQPNKQFGGTECTIIAKHGLINLVQLTGGTSKMNEMVATLKKQGAPVLPISGYGDQGFMAVAKADPNAPGVLGAIIFTKGNKVFALSVLGDIPEATLSENLKTMAAIAAKGM